MIPYNSSHSVQLVILDPGHFHAALVQKKMYPEVSPRVHVYAPEGPELRDYLSRVEGFNTRAEDPTRWETMVHPAPDYLTTSIKERSGNVMVTAGNNSRKTEYLKSAVDAGFNVLADKPMCIDAKGWELLCSAFESANENQVLLYDIMTERFEITSILQKEVMRAFEVFGDLETGTLKQPAVVKESVHHLSKTVAGRPLRRPPWYFDVAQQGEGIVDVTTHLVDLVAWICFPEEVVDYANDIRVLAARRWPTTVTRSQFERVTGLAQFPDYLQKDVNNEVLHYYCNGEMSYTLKGVHVKIVVMWNYEAPGGGDTHGSRICGSKADVVIRQGKTENYQPELYIEPKTELGHDKWESALGRFGVSLQNRFPGVEVRKEAGRWHLFIPALYRVGHEGHFSQVTESYLEFLKAGKLPQWEAPNMIAKYYTTTRALELAKEPR